MHESKLIAVGTSTGVILPAEMLARYKINRGDKVYLTEGADGLMLTPYDPSLAEQLKAGEQLMRDYRDTFKALAK